MISPGPRERAATRAPLPAEREPPLECSTPATAKLKALAEAGRKPELGKAVTVPARERRANIRAEPQRSATRPSTPSPEALAFVEAADEGENGSSSPAAAEGMKMKPASQYLPYQAMLRPTTAGASTATVAEQTTASRRAASCLAAPVVSCQGPTPS